MKIGQYIPKNEVSKPIYSQNSKNFSQILQKTTNEFTRNVDTYQASKQDMLSSLKMKTCQSGDVPIITTQTDSVTQLKALTHEQKSFLNKKYDLSKMKWGSEEYNSLMSELCEMGIISDLPNDALLNVISVHTDTEGNITSYITKADDLSEDRNLLDWFSKSIDLNSKKYENIFEYGLRLRIHFL